MNYCYTMIVLIEKRICIEHEYLSEDIYKYIFSKIKEITMNECTKNYGYILNIKRLVRIKDSYISNVNCDNIFTVIFEAETLKPEIGKEFQGSVCMLFPGGIFLNIKNKQKVLIPISSLENYVFDLTKKCLKKDKKIIKEGDMLDVCITGVKYSKQTFSCFGNLVEKS